MNSNTHSDIFWKGVSTNSAVPNFSRPLDGTEPYPSGPDFGARPIKHWRKQLNTINNSSRGRAGVGMPMDLPGGSVYLGNKETNTDCITCVTNMDGNQTTALKEDLFKYGDSGFDFQVNPEDSFYDCDQDKPVCVACNPENNIIRRATTVLSKKYYTDTKAYLKSRCITYDQKLSVNPVPGIQYVSADGLPLYPTDTLNGPQVRATQNCFSKCKTCTGCPTCTTCDVSCSTCKSAAACTNCNTNNTCVTKPSITIYKPNNQQFSVQGAVSSSARLDRLKYNTITTNGGSFYTAWGSAGANAGRYQGTMNGPYFLKNKFNKCEPAQYHTNGNKRICPPQPFN